MKLPNPLLRHINQNKSWEQVAHRYRRIIRLFPVAFLVVGTLACAFAILVFVVPQYHAIFVVSFLLSLGLLAILLEFRKTARQFDQEFGEKLRSFVHRGPTSRWTRRGVVLFRAATSLADDSRKPVGVARLNEWSAGRTRT